MSAFIVFGSLFQHTAARRRLDLPNVLFFSHSALFQHTAARRRLVANDSALTDDDLFQHTAARRRLAEQADSGVSP